VPATLSALDSVPGVRVRRKEVPGAIAATSTTVDFSSGPGLESDLLQFGDSRGLMKRKRRRTHPRVCGYSFGQEAYTIVV
jgi:hypothetical protein